MEADEPPARQKQRDIQQNCQNTHRQHRQQDIDGLRQTCDATHAYGICRKEPVKGQRENHRPQRYDGIAFQLLFQKLLPLIVCLSFMPQRRPTTMRKVHALYSRLICWSSESSSFTKAPAAGIARTR